MKALTMLAILAATSVLATPGPAFAQSAPDGIGFVQAEEGTWWCRDPDPSRAFACAFGKCRAEASGQDCYATRWCAPAAWSGLMVAWLPEFHNTIVLCGSASETAVRATLKAMCAATEELTRCDLVRLIDPDGIAYEIDDTTWPGPATSPTAE